MSGNDERVVLDDEVFTVLWGNKYHKRDCHHLNKGRRGDIQNVDLMLARRWRLKSCKVCKPKVEWEKDV